MVYIEKIETVMPLAIMARLVLCLLALCATSALASPEAEVEKLVEYAALGERQLKVLDLFQHVNEPAASQIIQSEASAFKSIDDNLEKYNNVTAAKTYAGIIKNKWYLPRSVPFSVNEPSHAFEAMTLFNVLYSAKDFETFLNTASYLRDITNPGLYVYTVSIAVIYRKDTQDIALPPIYETFPALFNNGEIIATAQRVNTHGQRYLSYYPSTYSLNGNVVIKANATEWPYLGSNHALSYFTNDYGLNAAQYFLSIVNPFWLGGSVQPGVIYKERRGEAWWFAHRQLIARYYMERLSNCLGEIPDITNVVDGFDSGLVYTNGVPLPVRPDNYRLDQPQLASALEKSAEFERRILEAIDKGYYVNRKGEQVSLLNDGGLEVLGNLIESNADSPNRYYYKDFIRVYKQILGNSIKSGYQYNNYFNPLIVPSPLENYQTALRDPAFYSLWKRILNLFVAWQKQMPLYTPEELTVPNVEIEKIEVDKLVTFFEYSLLNITNELYQNEREAKEFFEDSVVLVERQRLNHKPFSVSLKVKSDIAKKVIVKLFLAPKYDSKGIEIPLQQNTENFFLLDQFLSDLTAGESVITRKSGDFLYVAHDPATSIEITEAVNSGKWSPKVKSMSVFPHNLVLPKGSVGGTTFQLVAYIQEFDGFKQPYTPGFRVAAFPSDRPLYKFQIKNVKNLKFQDVKVYHEE